MRSLGKELTGGKCVFLLPLKLWPKSGGREEGPSQDRILTAASMYKSCSSQTWAKFFECVNSQQAFGLSTVIPTLGDKGTEAQLWGEGA